MLARGSNVERLSPEPEPTKKEVLAAGFDGNVNMCFLLKRNLLRSCDEFSCLVGQINH